MAAPVSGRRSACRELADLLEYPGPDLRAGAERCALLLEPVDPAAAALVGDFRRSIEALADGPIEEAYTGTFDLEPSRCLYVGHHLFGEDRRRNLFLAMLGDHYRKAGFAAGAEVADYLPAMLRFVAAHEGAPETGDLIHECMVPALRKMTEGNDGLYAPVLRAARRVLSEPDGDGGGSDR